MSLPQLRKRPLASLIAAAVFVATCVYAGGLLETPERTASLAAADPTRTAQ